MSISIYKPNSKNTGSGFSFKIGSSKNNDPALFITSILQHSYDSVKRQGYFKDNQDNPDKTIKYPLLAYPLFVTEIRIS